MGGWWKTPWQFICEKWLRQAVGKKRGVRVDFVVLEDRGGCQVCPGAGGLSFRVAPGSEFAVSASVRKGIWRAWWRLPCYLVQAQRGVTRAFLPTCDHSLSA